MRLVAVAVLVAGVTLAATLAVRPAAGVVGGTWFCVGVRQIDFGVCVDDPIEP